jgi:parallel beta-helix repeat protein
MHGHCDVPSFRNICPIVLASVLLCATTTLGQSTATPALTQPTETPTATPPATASATATPAPTPRVVHITLGSVIGGPGDAVHLSVSIVTSGEAVVATANDFTFPSPVLTLDPAACRINPAIGKSLRASVLRSDADTTTVRVLVQANVNVNPISDGPLYTCTVRISLAALPGTYPLTNDFVLAIAPTGTSLDHVTGADGAATVSLIGGACVGDCNQDGEVTIDELVAGVNIALGNQPADDCPPLDANDDGAVTIDELIVAVGNALSGCITAPTPAPTPTPTEPPPPITLFVRSSGNDSNSGSDAATALQTISRAVRLAHSGYRILVGPGTYSESVVTPTAGGAPQAVLFVAHPSGILTGDAPGAVIVDATGSAEGAGFKLSHSSDSLIDGFTITGAVDGAIIIRIGSNNVTVRNCMVSNNPGSGIRVQDSAGVLLFNNLVSGSGGQAIALVGQTSGSPDARVFGNTIVRNGDRGITVGTTQAASPRALLRNNIVQNNGLRTDPLLQNIKVFTTPPSDAGYDADFNLVFPPSYLPTTIAGRHDLGTDATFVFEAGDDYHLRPNSPAIDAGDALPPALEAVIVSRTTTGTNLDSGRLDLGFHFLP